MTKTNNKGKGIMGRPKNTAEQNRVQNEFRMLCKSANRDYVRKTGMRPLSADELIDNNMVIPPPGWKRRNRRNRNEEEALDATPALPNPASAVPVTAVQTTQEVAGPSSNNSAVVSSVDQVEETISTVPTPVPAPDSLDNLVAESSNNPTVVSSGNQEVETIADDPAVAEVELLVDPGEASSENSIASDNPAGTTAPHIHVGLASALNEEDDNEVEDGTVEDVEQAPNEASPVTVYLKDILAKAKKNVYSEQLRKGNPWIEPPDPDKELFNSLFEGKVLPSPAVYYYPRVYVFSPDQYSFSREVLNCPFCSGGKVQFKAWAEFPRRVADVNSTFYLLSSRLKCTNCPKTFMATSPEFLASLPSWIVYKFPALLTKRSGVSKEIVRLLNSSTDSGMGPKAVKEAILEQHTIRHAELQIRYYSVIESFLSFDFGHYREKPKRLVASLKARPDQIPCFSEFDDQKGFSGYVPSANYLKHVLNIDIERKRQYMDLEVQRRGGRVISVDHSFKVCFSCYSFNSSTDRAQVIKHICKVNGQPLFSGLFTAINEYGEVRCQLLVQSTSNRMLKEPLKNWKESAEKLNTTLPQIVFSDRCCDDHDFYCEAFPTLRQSLIAKPMLDVDMAKVHCYRGSDAVLMMERIKQELMDVQQKVVGLDCEWNRGNNSKVAVIQIALPNGSVYIYQPSQQSINLPADVSSFLEDETILKVGSHLHHDAGRLRMWNVDLCNYLSLAQECLSRGIIDKATHGLKYICETVLGKTLDKGQGSAVFTDWTVTLSAAQKLYAARDALAAILCYVEILKHPLQPFERTYSPLSPSSEELSPTSSNGDLQVVHRTVLLDAYHAMARIETPKNHPFSLRFKWEFRDAMFIMNDIDKQRVDAVCRKNGTTFENQLNNNSDYILARCRRLIPPPDILEQRCKAVMDKYSRDEYQDANGKPVLDSKARQAFNNLLRHIRKGCLSDPPGASFYFELPKKDTDGLTLYHCFRGTSGVEGGIHQKLAVKFRAWNASPQLADNFLALFRHRHNIRAGERHRPGFPKLGHFEHYMLDNIQVLIRKIYRTNFDNWWPLVSESPRCSETFGVVPCVPVEEQETIEEDKLNGLPAGVKFLAKRMKTLIPHLPVITREERTLYKQSAPFYVSTTKSLTIRDFDRMQSDWNAGTLKGAGDKLIKYTLSVDKVRKKLAEHLLQYFKCFARALNRQSLISKANGDISQIWNYLQRDDYIDSVAWEEAAVPERLHCVESLDDDEYDNGEFEWLQLEENEETEEDSELPQPPLAETDSAQQQSAIQPNININQSIVELIRAEVQRHVVQATIPTKHSLVQPVVTSANYKRVRVPNNPQAALVQGFTIQGSRIILQSRNAIRRQSPPVPSRDRSNTNNSISTTSNGILLNCRVCRRPDCPGKTGDENCTLDVFRR